LSGMCIRAAVTLSSLVLRNGSYAVLSSSSKRRTIDSAISFEMFERGQRLVDKRLTRLTRPIHCSIVSASATR